MIPVKPKKPKKTIRYIVKIKNCKKDFGMGKGVIGTQECDFTDENGRGWDSVMFLESIENTKQKIIDNLIKVEIQDINENRRN